MSRFRTSLRPLLSIVIIAATGYFFFRAFRRNWASVRAHEFQIAPLYLTLAVSAAIVTTMLATFAWQLAINKLSKREPIDFRQSIATVNASGLTKYIPGKVWSYALQMYWLNRLGISKGLIVYVNLVNQLISMGMAVALGLGCLLLSSSSFPRHLALATLVGLLMLDACCVIFNRAILNGLILLVNRLSKKKFGYFEVTKRVLFELHAVHLLAAVTYGLSASLCCLGVGYELPPGRALLVVAASLLSEVGGFLAIVVPGGLGVREGLMYTLLGGAAGGSLTLILPVASRVMNMGVDVLLGLVALRLLRTLATSKNVVPLPEGESNAAP